MVSAGSFLEMLKTRLLRLVVLASLVLTGCACSDHEKTALQPEPIQAQTPRAQPTPEIDCRSYIPDQFGSPMVEPDRRIVYTKEKLSYLGYEVSKETRKIDLNAGYRGLPKLYDDYEYVVLKRRGKIVARFRGREEHLVEAQFGLFPFLGGPNKELVVEATANKYWRYWIVSLSPRFEVIYDSGKYDLVFWLRPIDFDHDGRFELVQNLGTFWYVLGDNVSSPRPTIILGYDPRTHKYLPSNPRFQSQVLGDIDQRIGRGEEIKRNTSYSCPTLVYDVMLRYLYAGRKQEAWRFFEREYDEKDKREWEVAIKKKLIKDTVYVAIYRNPHR